MAMKRTVLLGCIFLLQLHLFSQSYNLKMGNAIRLKKGTLQIDIISSNKSGLFFAEERIEKMAALGRLGGAPVIHLHRVDENFSEVFDKDYTKVLKDFEYHSFQTINDKLYLFVTDYEKKKKLFKIYGVSVDKSSGKLADEFKELGSFPANNFMKGNDLKISSIENGSAIMMVTDISAEKLVMMDVRIFDANLELRDKAVLDFNYAPIEYALTDLKYARNKKIVCVGQHYEMVQGKKFRTRGELKEAMVSIFNENGKKEKEEIIVADKRYLIGGKLIEKNDGNFLLGGLYSNNLKYVNLSGCFSAHVNVNTGQISMSPFTALNRDMLGESSGEGRRVNFSETDQRTLTQIDEAIGKGEIENNFVLRTATFNEIDQSLIFTCENSGQYIARDGKSNFSAFHYNYDNNDIIVFKSDAKGNINWVNRLRKFQHEFLILDDTPISSGTSSSTGDFFYRDGAMPLYSSYSSSQINNKLVVIMNDPNEQTANPIYGDKLYKYSKFEDATSMWAVSIDLLTGKMERKFLCKNVEDQLMMPRHSMVSNNEFYIPSLEYDDFSGPEVKFARVEVH
jgi:hypothetical protein